MRNLAVVLALIQAAAAGAAPPAAAKSAGAASSDSAAGPHGAVLLPVPDDPTVSCEVWFQVGSQDDPPGKEGLAYLTGQMLAEAATTRNSFEQVLRNLYPLAASYDVRVDKEMTTLTGRTHRDNLEIFFGLFTDACLHPAFTAADFERLKGDALNYLEKTLRYSSDEELAKAALYGAVFEGSGYRHPPQGTVAGLKAVTLDEVAKFYAAHFTRERTVVALGGGYPEKLPERFEAALGALPANARAATTAAAPTPRSLQGRHVLLVSKPNADASISFGFPIDVHRGDPDFYALWVANSWLGEHRNSSSHLYQVIRGARGLNYGDYSYIEAFPEGGGRQMPPANVGRRQQLFEVWIRTLPNKNALFALRAAVRELQNLVDSGLTEEQFQLTRSFLEKYVLHFAPTTAERLGYAVDDRFYGLDPGHLAQFRRRLGELTRDQVNAAIRRHLQYRDLQIAIVTGDAETLRQALVAEAASPIAYEAPMPAEVRAEDEKIATFPLGVRAEDVQIVPVEEMFQK